MSNIFAKKTNRAFFQTIFMGFIALTALVFASLKAYQLSGLYFAVLIHKIKDACGCESMAQFFAMHPDIFRAVILFGVGIGIFIIYSLYKLIKLYSRTNKYIAHHLSFARARYSAKLKMAIKALELDESKIIEINKPNDLAVFCFDFWRPKICISHALVNLLGKDELKAVLAHEAQHMANYEPLKIFIVKYFRSIFFFLPGLKTSAKKYFTLSELAADEHACGSVAEKSSLAKAILKISDSSLSFSGSTIEERANRLSDDMYTPKFKFIDRSLIVGSLGLAAVSLIFIFVFSSSTKAFEMHNIAGCITPVNSESSDLACNSAGHENVLVPSGNGFLNMNSDDSIWHSGCYAK